MAQTNLPIEVVGHVKIRDDLGNTLLDQHNAVHPQNLARIFARALSNEHNFFINRVAFGNGGTTVNASMQIEYKTPNDGQDPDPAGWESRLYNETYSEVVDDSSSSIGVGPGASAAGDPSSQEHVSGPGVRSAELGLTSQVTVEVVLNPNEPFGQDAQDGSQTNPDSSFTFDEIGLFTSGLPATQTAGYQDINVSDKNSKSTTGLAFNTTYAFNIAVNGGASRTVSFVTPAIGSGTNGEILYSDLVTVINRATNFGASASITDVNLGTNTYGYLRFTSKTAGGSSKVSLVDTGAANSMFRALAGYKQIETAVNGKQAGIANDVTNHANERERMLTHIIFSPVLKSANRSLIITYTLTISIARSDTLGS